MDNKKTPETKSKRWYSSIVQFLAIVSVIYIAYLSATRYPKIGSAPVPGQLGTVAQAPVTTSGEPQAGRASPDSQVERMPRPGPTSLASHDDAAKASAQFRDSSRCVHAKRLSSSLRRQLDACNATKGTDTYGMCSKTMEHYTDAIVRLQAQSGTCEGNELIAEDQYFDAVLRAAMAGDTDAQVCLVDSDFHLSMPWSDQQREQYQNLAKGYVESALRRGDWKMVQLMATTSRGLGGRALLRSVTEGDPLYVYRMNRLLRQGAVGDYAQKLDILAKYFATSLAGTDIKAADDWALDTYRQHFAKASPLITDPTPCAASSSTP